MLTFENVARDTAAQYLAEGLADQIATRLGSVSRITLVSRTAVRRLRNPEQMSVQQVGRSLNASYLVNGSIRFHAGDVYDPPAKAGLADNSVETQAAASFSAWQVLEAAITATKSLDDKVLAQWLKKNRVDTIQGRLRFNGTNNYGDDLMRVKQVQNGQWVTVWPKEWAKPGAKLITP